MGFKSVSQDCYAANITGQLAIRNSRA